MCDKCRQKRTVAHEDLKFYKRDKYHQCTCEENKNYTHVRQKNKYWTNCNCCSHRKYRHRRRFSICFCQMK